MPVSVGRLAAHTGGPLNGLSLANTRSVSGAHYRVESRHLPNRRRLPVRFDWLRRDYPNF